MQQSAMEAGPGHTCTGRASEWDGVRRRASTGAAGRAQVASSEWVRKSGRWAVEGKAGAAAGPEGQTVLLRDPGSLALSTGRWLWAEPAGDTHQARKGRNPGPDSKQGTPTVVPPGKGHRPRTGSMQGSPTGLPGRRWALGTDPLQGSPTEVRPGRAAGPRAQRADVRVSAQVRVTRLPRL